MSIQDKDISEMTTDMMIFWMKMTSVQVKSIYFQININELLNLNFIQSFQNIWQKVFDELDNLQVDEYVINFLNLLLNETEKRYDN